MGCRLRFPVAAISDLKLLIIELSNDPQDILPHLSINRIDYAFVLCVVLKPETTSNRMSLDIQTIFINAMTKNHFNSTAHCNFPIY